MIYYITYKIYILYKINTFSDIKSNVTAQFQYNRLTFKNNSYNLLYIYNF